jgi:hypothetical protein
MSADSSIGKFVLRLLLFAVFSAVGMELFFRFGLHATENPRSVQDPLTGVSMYDTSWLREGMCTSGSRCLPLGRWRINNAGWNSIFDFSERTDASRPRIAVVGNSYIEGFASDVDSHMDAELFRLLDGEADVYAFGISGATFAQYVGMIRYIEQEFNPDIYLIMLSNFGINRSLDSCVSPYRFYLSETDSGFRLSPPREVFVQNRYGRVLFRSAFAMYLRLNKNAFPEVLQLLENEIAMEPIALDTIPDRVLAAGAFFVDTLERFLPGHGIILFACSDEVLDYLVLESVLEDESPILLFDLSDYMNRDFAANRISFQGADGGHWNSRGHRTAALALLPAVRKALADLGY